MKRPLALFLALLMALSLCACGGDNAAEPTEDAVAPTENAAGQPLGTTQSTDILEFTLNRADLCVALNNEWGSSMGGGEDYFLPKEYVASEDKDNPCVAATGHTLVSFTYTIHSLDRADQNLEPTITIGYAGETYTFAPPFDSPKYGWAHTLGEDPRSSEAMNMILDPDETLTRRGYVDIPVAAESTDELDFTIALPNSAGENVDLVYHVIQADREACAEADRLAAEKAAEEDAAIEAERLSDADPEVVKAVQDYVRDGSLSYNDYTYVGNSLVNTEHEIAFAASGNRASITVTSPLLTYTEEGTYSVRKEVILFEMDNGCTPVMPYTYENGEIHFERLEGAIKTLQ